MNLEAGKQGKMCVCVCVVCVCVCVGVCGERMGFNAFRYCCSSMRLSWSPEALERATTVA